MCSKNKKFISIIKSQAVLNIREWIDFMKASKKKKVILLETKNYDVFVEYKILYKEEKNIIRSNERAIL